MSRAEAQTVALAWPSPWRAWWAVAVFCIGAILSYTDRQILSLLVDPIRADLKISEVQISLLQGLAFSFIYSLIGLPLGRLADTMRRREVIIAGVVVWTAATVACGLADSFASLFVARMFVGVGEAALAPAAMSVIADLFPPHRRGTAIGVFLTGMVIGGGVALGIGGGLLAIAQSGLLAQFPLLGDVAPWRAVLMLLGLPGALVIVLLLSVREPARRHEDGGAAIGRLNLRQMFAEFAQRRRVILPLLAAMAMMSAGDFSLLNWAPVVLSRNYHLGPAAIGALLGTAVILTGLSGTLAGGLVSDRLAKAGGGLRARLTAAAIAAALALPGAAICFAADPVWAMAAFCVWSLFSSASATIGITAMQDAVPNAVRGVSVASISLGNMLVGLGLGTMTTALLTEHLFADPLAVAKSISILMTVTGVLGVGLYLITARRFQPLHDH